jgi:MFS transporter, FSR family, fosmidomycin resistance protein
VAGPLLLGAGLVMGLGWRELMLLLGGLTLLVTFLVWRQPRLRANGHAVNDDDGAPLGLRAGLRQALAAVRQRIVLRWLVLLEFSDFMLDILLGFLALYFVDVVGVSPALAGTAVAVWSGAGLLSDALLIPLLERVRGLSYLRVSALVVLVLFPTFLLVPGFAPKLVVLALMGLANAGWYAILQGQLYSAMPGRSGTAMAVNSVFSLVTGAVPALLGFIAHQAGLPVTMWLLLLGPLALLVGIPRQPRVQA